MRRLRLAKGPTGAINSTNASRQRMSMVRWLRSPTAARIPSCSPGRAARNTTSTAWRSTGACRLPTMIIGDASLSEPYSRNQVEARAHHGAASMDKVGEGHTALRWRIARGCRHAPDSTRTRRRQCVLARDYKHNITSTMRIMASYPIPHRRVVIDRRYRSMPRAAV